MILDQWDGSHFTLSFLKKKTLLPVVIGMEKLMRQRILHVLLVNEPILAEGDPFSRSKTSRTRQITWKASKMLTLKRTPSLV